MENRLMVQDGHLLAVFNSAHRIMKAESILKGRGLPILLIPAPRALSTDCGLALRFTDEEFDSIMEILTQENVLPAYVNRRINFEKYELIWNGENSIPLLHS
ncbi:MAG: DUF3343 domain-containing protein [Desulfuromonadales bacterium]